VENAHISRSVEERFKKFLDLDAEVNDFQNLIIFSLANGHISRKIF